MKAISLGRANTLILNSRSPLWGRVDWELGRVVLHDRQSDAHDDDILDDCVEKMIRESKSVIDAPGILQDIDSPMIAILDQAS